MKSELLKERATRASDACESRSRGLGQSPTLKTAVGFGAILIGLALLIGGVRLGTDPELEALHRAAAAGAMTPAGLLLLRTSFRVMRKTDERG